MNDFGETLRRLRIEKGLSQQQLADHLHVSRPTVANWEVSRRIPDATMIAPIADALGVDTGVLLASAEALNEPPNVILVDDKPIILEGGLPILRQALPGANVGGCLSGLEVLDYIIEALIKPLPSLLMFAYFLYCCGEDPRKSALMRVLCALTAAEIAAGLAALFTGRLGGAPDFAIQMDALTILYFALGLAIVPVSVIALILRWKKQIGRASCRERV